MIFERTMRYMYVYIYFFPSIPHILSISIPMSPLKEPYSIYFRMAIGSGEGPAGLGLALVELWTRCKRVNMAVSIN